MAVIEKYETCVHVCDYIHMRKRVEMWVLLRLNELANGQTHTHIYPHPAFHVISVRRHYISRTLPCVLSSLSDDPSAEYAHRLSLQMSQVIDGSQSRACCTPPSPLSQAMDARTVSRHHGCLACWSTKFVFYQFFYKFLLKFDSKLSIYLLSFLLDTYNIFIYLLHTLIACIASPA